MRFFLITTTLWILSANLVFAQGNAYAKFDSKGATIGLYNLLADPTGCENSQAFTGTITKVDYEVGESAYSYSFTLAAAGGKRLNINLIVEDDDILQPDVEDLITKNRRVRVRARQCGSGGLWTAEEIKRL